MTSMFWCKCTLGHEGICENGVSYSSEPYRGTLTCMLYTVSRLNAQIVEASKDDHGRKVTDWRETTCRIRYMSGVVEDILRWWNNRPESIAAAKVE